MRQQSINGEDAIIWYDRKKNQYLVIYSFGMFYYNERPTTDQEIEDMELELEQLRLERENIFKQIYS